MMKKTIEACKGKEILFHATHVVEFFSAPLPEDLDGEDVSTEADLFRASHVNGYNEIFLAEGKTINGECEGKKCQFAIEDFLRWQLERVNEETLWQLISKTDAAVTEILDGDAEYEKDPDYNPEGWLNFYARDEYPGKAEAYIKRLRQEAPDEFYGALIESMLDDRYGLLNTEWFETEIDENLDDVRSSYAEWEVPLMVVSTGKFLPYISTDNDHNLMMDDYKLNHMYVRNYDEGDPT
jgi:hypothetical protein